MAAGAWLALAALPLNRAPAQDEATKAPPAATVAAAAARPVPPLPLEPGPIVQFDQTYRSAGVTTLTLGNGVVVHHRAIRPRPADAPPSIPAPPAAPSTPDPGADAIDGSTPSPASRRPGPGTRSQDAESRVMVSICVTGGEIQESVANRGITLAAFDAWDRLSVRSFRRDDLLAYLQEHKVRLWSRVSSDSVMLRIESDLGGVEHGLRVARLLLTEPVVSNDNFDAWRSRIRSRRESIGGQGMPGRRAVFDTVVDVVFAKDDPRPRRMTDEALDSLTAGAAQHWIDAMLGVAPGSTANPIEASIVGDVSIKDAARLASLYLGTLSSRPRLTGDTFADARRAARNDIPMIDTRTVDGMQDRAYIIAGFLGADLADIRDYRSLAVAAEIIERRLKQWPPDERGERADPADDNRRGGGAGVQAIPGSAFPGFGLVLAVSEVPPHRAPELLEKLSAIFESVRERGPGDDELRQVTSRLAGNSRDVLQRTGYWSNVLASSTYHRLPLDQMIAAESHYAGTTASDVQAVLQKYDAPDRRIRVRLMPGRKGQ
ncbi:MAG: insulinase family protein [Phycisphaerales bacterium]